MTEWKIKFIEKIHRSANIYSFRFERPEDLKYKSGQFSYFYIQYHYSKLDDHHICRKPDLALEPMDGKSGLFTRPTDTVDFFIRCLPEERQD